MAAAVELAASVGMTRAAAVFALPRATLYRARRPAPLGPPAPRPAPRRALTAAEQQAVLAVLNSARFVDRAPKAVRRSIRRSRPPFAAGTTGFRRPGDKMDPSPVRVVRTRT